MYSKVILNLSILKKISTHYQRTFKQFHILILIVLICSCSSPSIRHEIIHPASLSADDISTKKHIPQSHRIFLARFIPEIQQANNKILMYRNKILDFQDTLKEKGRLNESQLNGLNRTLARYRLSPLSQQVPSEDQLKASITQLLKRLDIIPLKLVMAQAIIESGWGSSGFAKNGNNYFGVHCYTEGCGVKPAGNDSADFYVKTYPTEMAGIEDYLWILNTGHAYRGLRQTRLDL